MRVILYLPSLNGRGLHETETGTSIRFLPMPWWYRPLAKLRRACRATRWSLYAQERLNAAAFAPALKRAMREDGAGALYLQEYWGGRFDRLAGRVGVPVVAQDHGGLARGVVKWFKRKSFARAAELYAQTDDEVRTVARYGKAARLQPNGIDASFFRPPPPDAPPRAKTVLTVARLTDKQKRTSDLIRATARLDDSWSLDVAGTGPDRATLEKLAADLGVSGRVRFLGFVGKDRVRSLLQTCGVYAMPSANEGLPLAIMEAMACGAACVVSRIRAFDGVIDDGENGLTAPVADPPALAAAINKAWAGRDALGRAAVETVANRFDAKALYRRLADTLRAAAEVAR